MILGCSKGDGSRNNIASQLEYTSLMLIDRDAAGRPTYKSVHETAFFLVYRQALAVQSRLLHRTIPLVSFDSMGDIFGYGDCPRASEVTVVRHDK